jgi:hypothetical protein
MVVNTHRWPRLRVTCCVFTLWVVRKRSAIWSTTQSWAFLAPEWEVPVVTCSPLSHQGFLWWTFFNHKTRVVCPQGPGTVYLHRHKFQKKSFYFYHEQQVNREYFDTYPSGAFGSNGFHGESVWPDETELGLMRDHWIIGPPFVDLKSLTTMSDTGNVGGWQKW